MPFCFLSTPIFLPIRQKGSSDGKCIRIWDIATPIFLDNRERNYGIKKLRPSSLMENKMNNSLDWMDNKLQRNLMRRELIVFHA